MVTNKETEREDEYFARMLAFIGKKVQARSQEGRN